MPSCAIALCKNYNQKTKGTDVKYFRFPTNSDLAKQWIASCKREGKINLKNGKCFISIILIWLVRTVVIYIPVLKFSLYLFLKSLRDCRETESIILWPLFIDYDYNDSKTIYF